MAKITLYEIAKLADTSKSTVSRVLNGGAKVNPKLKEKIEAIISEHHYQPSLAARALSSHGRKGLIGVISGSVNAGYFSSVLQGLNEEFSKHGSKILTTFARSSEEYTELYHFMMEKGIVDGVIFIAPPPTVFQSLPAKPNGVVLSISSRPQKNEEHYRHYHSICVENKPAFNNLCLQLKKQGRENVLFVEGPESHYDARERKEAMLEFESAHPSFQLRCMSHNMIKSIIEGKMTHPTESGFLMPETIVSYNDSTAADLLMAMHQHGGITKNTLVIGCDADESYAHMGFPTIKMPMKDLGIQAATMFNELVALNLDLQHLEPCPAKHHLLSAVLPKAFNPSSIFSLLK